MAINAKNRENVQPFAGNGDISIWLKIEWDEKKQRNKLLFNFNIYFPCLMIVFLHILW